jgi:LuxR family maltose regulon positive regulatory protein
MDAEPDPVGARAVSPAAGQSELLGEPDVGDDSPVDSPVEELARAIAAQDWSRAMDIVESSWRSLVTERFYEVANGIRAIPLSTLRGRPLAWAVHGLTNHAPDPQQTPAQELIPATQLDRVGSGPEALYALDLSFVMAAVYRLRGRFRQAQPYSDQMVALARIAEATDAPNTAGVLAGVYVHAALLHIFRGEDDAAVADLLDGYRFVSASDQKYRLRDVTGKLALIFAMRGEMHTARGWLDIEADSDTIAGPFAALVDSAGAIARAIVTVNELEYDQSSRALSVLEDGSLQDEHWAFTLHARTLLVLGWGDRLGHLDVLNQARLASPTFEESRRNGGIAAPLLAAAEANLLMSLGRGNQAWVILNYGAEPHPLLDVARARLTLLAGDSPRALQIAQAMIGDGYNSQDVAGTTPSVVLDLLLVSAVALHRLGRDREATGALQTAIDRSGPERVFAFGFVPRADLLELLDQLRQARSLLTDDVLARLPDIFPAEVSVLELTGQERLILDGLVAGQGASDIAAELYVSMSTVKTHQRNLYRKLGVNSREDALAAAAELGLLTWSDQAGRSPN